jgi:AraC-like DNA-binding protein
MLHRILWDTREEVPPGSVVGPEVRNLYLIECNVSGYGSVVINGKEFSVGPRCCYVLHPGDEVTLKAAEKDPRLALWCLFGGAKAGEILRAAGITADSPFVSKEKFDELLEILEKLYAIRLQSDLGSELLKTAYIYEFLGVVARGKTDISKKLPIERAITIMETESNTDLSVSDISDELGFDRSYFTTLFKKHTGISPYAYLTRIRIKKACGLLENSDLPMSEIAERVGINAHNFARIFKREMGSSPAEYRRSKE